MSRVRPNIILMMTDQQRYDTIGALGYPHMQTPNLDRLAHEGVVFEHCYCTPPSCVPSRASFFNAQYPHALKVYHNHCPIAPLFALFLQLSGGGRLARAYPIVFAALGVFQSIRMLGFRNYLMGIARDGMRTIYIGLSNTILGALALAPVLGGWLLEATSYSVLFGITVVITGAGFILSLFAKRSPFDRRMMVVTVSIASASD